ncbi:hypothetical protein [Gracilibacillus sp. JCM 18860]
MKTKNYRYLCMALFVFMMIIITGCSNSESSGQKKEGESGGG